MGNPQRKALKTLYELTKEFERVFSAPVDIVDDHFDHRWFWQLPLALSTVEQEMKQVMMRELQCFPGLHSNPGRYHKFTISEYLREEAIVYVQYPSECL